MRSAIIAAIGALLVACEDSNVSRQVGARCDEAAECEERCLSPSGDYPGGFCTISCNARNECPSDTTCAEREGGVCLFECTGDPDCAFLGAGWRCELVDLRGGGIQVRVCHGD